MFLILPGELRNLIVEFAFAGDPNATPLPLLRSPLALPLVCRQLYNEYYTLALSATVFTIRCRRLNELQTKANDIPPTVRSHMKKLQLSGKLHLSNALLLGSFRGLDLNGAGLLGIEELYISPVTELMTKDHPFLNPRILAQILWKTVVGNEALKIIYIVHGKRRSYPVNALVQLMEMQQLRYTSEDWVISLSNARTGSQVSMYDNGLSEHRNLMVVLGHELKEREVVIAFRADATKADVSSRVREILLGSKLFITIRKLLLEKLIVARKKSTIMTYEVNWVDTVKEVLKLH